MNNLSDGQKIMMLIGFLKAQRMWENITDDQQNEIDAMINEVLK